MSVSNGQFANQTTFNTAFPSRIQDTSIAGRIDLESPLPESGADVINVQREVNGLGAFTGRNSGAAFDSEPAYSSTNVVTQNNTLLDAISELDAEYDSDTGSLAFRAGRESIGDGDGEVLVVFSTPWVDTAYIPTFVFENVTDADPIFLMGIITSRANTGFTVKKNAPTDSGNYVLNWSVRKPE